MLHLDLPENVNDKKILFFLENKCVKKYVKPYDCEELFVLKNKNNNIKHVGIQKLNKHKTLTYQSDPV